MPLEGINFLLDAVGFQNLVEHLCLIEAGLADYKDFCYLVEKDIWHMAEEFSKQMVVQGRITFGLSHIKHLMGLMHWIQDCFYANNDPDSVTFDEEALAKAQSHALIHKSDLNLVNTNSKVANASKFKDEHKWLKCSKAFTNYLSVIPGVNGVPLVYVVCEEEDPEDGAEYLTFTEQMIACAPLKGQYYEADSHCVHTALCRRSG